MFDVLVEAVLVDCMAAGVHVYDGHGAGKHVVVAYRAVGAGGVLYTFVVPQKLDGQAGVTLLAVEEVLAKAEPQPAYTTRRTVVDILGLIVVVEYANRAVVYCKFDVTRRAVR